MLNWSSRFNIFCFLDNNHYQFESPAFDCLLAVGCKRSVQLDRNDLFTSLKQFYDGNPSWLFGHISYPENKMAQPDPIGFEDAFFFEPEILVTLKGQTLTIESDSENHASVFKAIDAQPAIITKKISTSVRIHHTETRKQYLDKIASLKRHIQRGDCYEINYCQAFFAEEATLDPLYLYHALTSVSPNPFAAMYKLNDRYCLCASPERFIKKTGELVISQPIKGTSKRYVSDALADIQSKEQLLHSEKDKTENVMIVDLVRNDLSRICTEGSVHVKELFGIYSFPQVHQMISTIEGKVSPATHWTAILEACFPMGSMTGAPKVKVMELIDAHENFSRGLFSGTIGYVTPAGDFDFNVVIRSLFYHESKKLVSFKAGGGITFNSDAENEYEESLLKAAAIKRILEQY